MSASTIGFPRTGPRREMKFALESYWKGTTSEAELLATAHKVEADAWNLQKAAGVSLIGLDGTLYDQVLDTTTWLGVIPLRFQSLSGLPRYFAMSRGGAALDMSKFLDTNYHYLVPELAADFAPQPDLASFLDKVARGQAAVGREAAMPIVIGPVTFVALAKGCPLPTSEAVRRLLPAYCELLRRLAAMGVPEVQMHEPVLATSAAADLKAEFEAAYQQLSQCGVPLHLVTYYDDLGAAYPWAVQLPVAAVTLDFLGAPGAAVPAQTLALIRQHGFPADKRLVAGVVDGRSVWADNGTAVALLRELLSSGAITADRLMVTSSAPLQHLPYDLDLEGDHLPPSLAGRLGFAKQKLAEMVAVAAAATSNSTTTADAANANTAAVAAAVAAAGGTVPCGAGDTAHRQGLPDELFSRSQPYAARREVQVQLPAFPTTTIGSFPQTAEVRRLRQQLKTGKLSQSEYERLITGHIAYAVGVQDALELDVLVHGEAERTDMVEYFGVKLGGMWFTTAGWVQSYGSRYVRPPLVVGDIEYRGAMTVWEYEVAESYTSRPVKGMLTGPVTILNWSFPRKDLSRAAQALQLALALRQEVAALEAAGCKIVQVDDPALREGLPLKRERWDSYLGWAVDAFRLCTGVAKPATQVVTHLCYSDFDDILPAVDRMDADVLTIENSRSDNAMISALAAAGYGRDIGPGVYDVHSPVVPTVEFIKSRISSFVSTGILDGRYDRIWVNPDCGLKTRAWPETIAALRNMVAAAAAARQDLAAAGGVSCGLAAAATPAGGTSGASGAGGCRGCC
ncbi:5-methyltetrahydropteroyltriglutamate--homocysteine methyltransferase [Tetrabaena socialis]|uniref:5-methyltetrahydropteroyltriglutamate--homocysteine S-methyltransferase n=1 Tax=Tetrabaena socialis TaxID=47790 RepID=A0A2J8A8V6_9CHLO|nr:5-methyltetrahydropteroyltriglutamate--homocysteine methyltransferase [Tetrabaena socialis]|eukprot:PNH08972.1 5-methyltetrahydropteroyltriglutamate--homocysteine methyltransferase [Tetrabaena socialis]